MFRKAIRQIIDKDEEYGYRTVVDISGGLDSRMNAVIAKEEEKKHKLLGITYAQKNSDDDKIASDVAKKLNIETFFYAMDNADFLKDIDILTFMNGGFNYYFGLTAGQRVLSTIDFQSIGIEIWGLLGDMYEGTYSTKSLKEDSHGIAEPEWSANSYRITKRFKVADKPKHRHNFEDNELLWFYVRGMLAGMNTGLIRQNYVEPITPYGDVDFMDFSFSIPYEKRTAMHICRQWLIKKYPQMAAIPYSGTGFPITSGRIVSVFSRIRWLYRGICRKVLGIQKKEWSMNPFEVWYKDNREVKAYVNRYYEENVYVINNDKVLEKK